MRGENHQDLHNALLSLVVDGVVGAAVLTARWIVVGKLRRERARSSLNDVLMTGNSASLGAPPRAGRPERIYKPRPGLNDISVLSTSYYVRSLSRDKAVIRRMSTERGVLISTGCSNWRQR